MSEFDLVRSHVERCLQDLWGFSDLQPDCDRDYRYRSGSAACYVGIDAGEPVLVKAVACAVIGVKKSTKLLSELNDVNARCRTSHVYWENNAVIVEQTMLAHTVDRHALAHAGQSVAAVANDVGPMIATVFGGHTPLTTTS